MTSVLQSMKRASSDSAWLLPLPEFVSLESFELIKQHCRENGVNTSTVLRGLHRDQLHALMLAANYFDIPDLLDATCRQYAFMIRNMRVDEIKDML